MERTKKIQLARDVGINLTGIPRGATWHESIDPESPALDQVIGLLWSVQENFKQLSEENEANQIGPGKARIEFLANSKKTLGQLRVLENSNDKEMSYVAGKAANYLANTL